MHLPQMLQLGLDIFATSFPQGMLLLRNSVPAEKYKEPGKFYIEQVKLLQLHFPKLFDAENYKKVDSFVEMRDHQLHIKLRKAALSFEALLAINGPQWPGLSLYEKYWMGKKRDIHRLNITMELYDFDIDMAVRPFVKDRYLHLQIEEIDWSTITSHRNDGRYVIQNDLGTVAFRLKIHHLDAKLPWIEKFILQYLDWISIGDQSVIMKVVGHYTDIPSIVQGILHRVSGRVSEMVQTKLFSSVYPILSMLQLEPPDLKDEYGEVDPNKRRHCYDADIAIVSNPKNDLVPYNHHMLGLIIADQMVMKADRLPRDPMAVEFPIPQVPFEFASICRRDPFAVGCGSYRGSAFAQQMDAEEENENDAFAHHPSSYTRNSRFSNLDNLFGVFVRWIQTRIHHAKGFEEVEPIWPDDEHFDEGERGEV